MNIEEIVYVCGKSAVAVESQISHGCKNFWSNLTQADLSRFGRNYLETGNYLERIFPFMDVRFVAINDNFDTLTAAKSSDGYIVLLKNIINAAYSKDISRKIISSLSTKQQKGEFIGNWAAYGYRKCPDDKHHIEPDEETL